MRLISVVLGTDSKKARASTTKAILNYGFRFYESHTLYDEDEVISRPRLWKGEFETLPVGLTQSLAVTIPRGEYSKLDAVMDIDKDIEAPVSRGQQVGVVKVSLDGEELRSVPLVALESIDEGSLFQIAKDYVMRMLD
jgi:D-alanyl-D-alanine carboxypeptidase (penicillin-binding protein 5/6)